MTEEQRNVWWLAREIVERVAGAIDPAKLDAPRGTAVVKGRPELDWALSYFACLPRNRGDIVRKYHEEDITRREAMSARASIRWFYKRLQERRLYGEGLRMLEKLK